MHGTRPPQGALTFDLGLETLVEADVVDVRARALPRIQHLEFVRGGFHALTQFAAGIIEVAKDAGAADTGLDAGR